MTTHKSILIRLEDVLIKRRSEKQSPRSWSKQYILARPVVSSHFA
ncbi:MAG: hypothetical protein ACON48_08450 [Chitinophagales bacterium]